jgi:hypothetical protein
VNSPVRDVKLSTAVGSSASLTKDLKPYLGGDGHRFEGIEQSSRDTCSRVPGVGHRCSRDHLVVDPQIS